MKVNRNGQAAIISDADYAKIRKCFKSAKYRLLFDIARYTGERWGAIVQLTVEDVYDDALKPRAHITFKAATRKASPDGRRKTRTVPVHPTLLEHLQAYRPPTEGWLFPSRIKSEQPITLRVADCMLRNAIENAGLAHKGISTHSTRRTLITRLWEKGCDLFTIQSITGHQDPKMVVNYIEADPTRIAKAIALL